MLIPKFTLRVKLILVSILLFTIPLSGFWYAAKMGVFLYGAQEQAVSLTAKAVSTILNNRPELFERNLLESLNTKNEIRVYNLDNRISLDGNYSDWGDIVDKAEKYDGQNALYTRSPGGGHLSFRHVSAKFKNHIYALFIVYDSNIIHRKQDSLHLDKSDHLQIALESREGKLNLYKMSPANEGWVTGYLMADDPTDFIPVKNESRIQGIWKNTAFGYVLEVRIPMDLVKNRISFALADVNDPVTREVETLIGTGGVNELEDLGALLVRTPELEKILNALERPGTRIWVVDKIKRVRAIVGDLYSESPVDATNPLYDPPRLNFLQPVYDFFSKRLSKQVNENSHYLAKLELEDLNSSLAGHSVSFRRAIPNGDSEIITAIEPLKTGDDILGAVVVEQTTDSILAVENKIIENTIFITIIVFTIGTIVLFIFASRLSGRVRKLSFQADAALSKDGRISEAFKGGDESDEIGDLSRSLSTMMRRLHEYHDYQEKMAYNLEHELRTPMAAISASLTNLNENLRADSDVGGYLGDARDNLKRIENILSKIRDATMLKDALRQDEPEEFDLGKALNAWVNKGYCKTFPTRKFVLDIGDDSYLIKADPNRIYQMLDKIIENAVDFSPEDSVILISLDSARKDLRSTKHEAILKIANQGPTISTEVLGQIFNSMYSKRETNNQDLHMGLGLYIVRTVAEFHGGSVRVDNREDGTDGVVFKIAIPLAA